MIIDFIDNRPAWKKALSAKWPVYRDTYLRIAVTEAAAAVEFHKSELQKAELRLTRLQNEIR